MSNTVCAPPIRLPRRLPRQHTNEGMAVPWRCGAWSEAPCRWRRRGIAPGYRAFAGVVRYRGIVATGQDGRAENLRAALSRPGSVAAPADSDAGLPTCWRVGA